MVHYALPEPAFVILNPENPKNEVRHETDYEQTEHLGY
jgi:hypothetical protein